MLRHNLEYKAIAAGVALFIWFYVMFEVENPVVERRLSGVAVEARGGQEGVAVTFTPEQVSVTVMGPKRLVAALESDDVRASVDVRGLKAGTSSVTPGCRVRAGMVAQVAPAKVKVLVQPLSSARRRVDFDLLGSPVGQVVGQVTAAPAEVRLIGPEDHVKQVVRVLARVDLAGAGGGFRGFVRPQALDADDERVAGIRMTPARVWVEVPLEPAGKEFARTVPVVVQTRGHPARGYRIVDVELVPAVATVLGGAPEIEEVRTQPLSLDDARRDMSMWLSLETPSGASAVHPDRVRVSLTISAKR